MSATHPATAGASPASYTLAARRTPVYRTVDVLVCGGGLAGVAAAVAAARAGAETLLVERNVVLGGNGPLAFEIGLESSGTGISAEIVERLRAGGNAEPDETAGGALVCDPEALKYACLDLIRDAGVSLLLSSWASEPIVDDGVRGAMVENKSGRFAIPAGVVIDATGDGTFASRADVAFHEPETCALALNARIGGIDIDMALASRDRWPALVAAAKRAGTLEPAQPDTITLYGVTPTARRRGIAFVAGPTFTGRRGWVGRDLSDCESVARRMMRAFIAFLKTVPGFEHSFVIDVAGTLQIHGAQRMIGEEVLSGEAAAPFLVGANVAPEGSEPPSSLKARGIDGLLTVGRAASIAPELHIDHAALGEAGGRAAAVAAAGRRGTRLVRPGPMIAEARAN